VPPGVVVVSASPPPLIVLGLPVTGPPPATGALASLENATGNLVFLPLPIDKELRLAIASTPMPDG
jgi:hypothetical protein